MTTRDSIDNPEQANGTKEGCYERPDDASAADAEYAQDSSIDQATDGTDDNIAQDTQLVILNQLVSKCASDTTDNNPNNPFLSSPSRYGLIHPA